MEAKEKVKSEDVKITINTTAYTVAHAIFSRLRCWEQHGEEYALWGVCQSLVQEMIDLGLLEFDKYYVGAELLQIFEDALEADRKSK